MSVAQRLKHFGFGEYYDPRYAGDGTVGLGQLLFLHVLSEEVPEVLDDLVSLPIPEWQDKYNLTPLIEGPQDTDWLAGSARRSLADAAMAQIERPIVLSHPGFVMEALLAPNGPGEVRDAWGLGTPEVSLPEWVAVNPTLHVWDPMRTPWRRYAEYVRIRFVAALELASPDPTSWEHRRALDECLQSAEVALSAYRARVDEIMRQRGYAQTKTGWEGKAFKHMRILVWYQVRGWSYAQLNKAVHLGEETLRKDIIRPWADLIRLRLRTVPTETIPEP